MSIIKKAFLFWVGVVFIAMEEAEKNIKEQQKQLAQTMKEQQKKLEQAIPEVKA